ncbi:DUF4238 domain-containing protein [Shewanella vaxholmensis]|uniref:DUF4238 domain-containing protein n=1 Tax=Shewanella vaxholmensis TaxID=3063535 RepID=A0ABU9UQB7_9GAMM
MKKKQHYVWKYYLSSWANESNQIWCRRDNNFFYTALENIAQKRYFYEAEALNDLEQEIVYKQLASRHPSSIIVNASTLNVYDIVSRGDEEQRRCGLEEYHTEIEHKVIDTIKLLLNKDMSWIEEKTKKIDFCNFLGIQYTRTNRSLMMQKEMIQEVLKKNPKYNDNVDPIKIVKVLNMVMSNHIGNWIYSSGLFSLISNNSDVEFVTGDQPILNIGEKHEDGVAKEMKIYYPLSPKIALLISNYYVENDIHDENEVKKYNNFIIDASFEQIYASSKCSLERACEVYSSKES